MNELSWNLITENVLLMVIKENKDMVDYFNNLVSKKLIHKIPQNMREQCLIILNEILYNFKKGWDTLERLDKLETSENYSNFLKFKTDLSSLIKNLKNV